MNHFSRPFGYADVVLDSELSQELEIANVAYGTNIQELVLAALYKVHSKIYNMIPFTFWLETHGRFPWRKDQDVARTVGWFTSTYPVVISAKKSSDDVSSFITMVRTKLKSVKDGGISYGALRWLAKKNKMNASVKRDLDINIAFK